MRPFALVAASAVLVVSSFAWGQPRAEAELKYVFDDDALLGETLGTTPPTIRGSKRARRVLLIRPRASFVAETLKSVEAL